MDEVFALLPAALLPWYRENARDLPWRRDRQPYHIWVSEVMLQQTRVEAVKGYYARFLGALPDILSLARCDDEILIKLWEGLGYYSRVRNLKKAAVVIADQYGGRFPESYTAVRALPGIGEYTAGAICSIAFDQPTPAVDGNVMRLAARLTGDETPVESPAFRASVRDRLAEVYPAEAGTFTQALMELGATLCGPNRPPQCDVCPCRGFCRGAAQGTAADLPVRLPKKQRRREERTVLILRCEGLFALTKRPARGLLAGLWQYPDVPGTLEIPQAVAWVEENGLKVREIYRQVEKNHIFTHIEWTLRGIYMEVWEPLGPFTWMTGAQIDATAALPTAYRQFRDALPAFFPEAAEKGR